jgi:hypothetical protein
MTRARRSKLGEVFLANTQRPPPAVIHSPHNDELQALSDKLEVAEQPSESLTPPPLRSRVRGNDDELLDLSALAQSGVKTPAVSVRSSAPPGLSEPPRPQLQLDEEQFVVPRRTRPTWLVPLMLGISLGIGISGVLFGTSRSGHRPAAGIATTAVVPAADTLSVAPRVVTANPSTAVAPQPAKLPGEDVAAPQPAAAPLAATTAPSATATAKSTRNAVENAPIERTAARTAPSMNTFARTSAVAAEPNEPAPAPRSDLAPPVLVVRAAEPVTAPLAAATPSLSATSTSTEASRASSNSLNTLLDNALSPEARRAELTHAEASSSAEALTPTPSTQDIAHTLGSVQFAIRGCAMGQTGTVTAALSIRNDGQVTSAQIIGAPFSGTPAGRCMEGVLRSAHFRPFKQSIFSVHYPLSID